MQNRQEKPFIHHTCKSKILTMLEDSSDIIEFLNSVNDIEFTESQIKEIHNLFDAFRKLSLDIHLDKDFNLRNGNRNGSEILSMAEYEKQHGYFKHKTKFNPEFL